MQRARKHDITAVANRRKREGGVALLLTSVILVLVSALPPNLDETRAAGIKLISLSLAFDTDLRLESPWILAGVKSTSYAENVIALREAKLRGATEAILPNTVGNLCEGTGTNVFCELDGGLVTPPLSSGCLAGITRELILEVTDAAELDVPIEHLGSTTEAFLTSSTRDVMLEWIRTLSDEIGDGFPEKVTAFRPGMAVHGRFDEPCPVCDSPIQRIVYRDRETNYCATCQTGGKLLADRALSRLLKKDWPRTLEEME